MTFDEAFWKPGRGFWALADPRCRSSCGSRSGAALAGRPAYVARPRRARERGREARRGRPGTSPPPSSPRPASSRGGAERLDVKWRRGRPEPGPTGRAGRASTPRRGGSCGGRRDHDPLDAEGGVALDAVPAACRPRRTSRSGCSGSRPASAASRRNSSMPPAHVGAAARVQQLRVDGAPVVGVLGGMADADRAGVAERDRHRTLDGLGNTHDGVNGPSGRRSAAPPRSSRPQAATRSRIAE